jgi:glutamate/tyrosine decarboxylase-like PLP-dependent enzyme
MTAEIAERVHLPRSGMSRDDVREALERAHATDVWSPQTFAPGVNYMGGDDVTQVAKDAYMAYFSTNALYTKWFPSLGRFEQEIVGMTASLLHGEQAVGSVTSGGSESILLGVKSARDRGLARHPNITAPEMVVPESAHPAFWKASHYFGIKIVRTPLRRGTWDVDLDAYRAAVTDNTVLMVGSAPSLTLGLVDSIPEMAAIAAERDASFLVDSCVGGYFLPFAERLGVPIRPYDFRVPGVTHMTADLHKYGYAAKGASVLLSRDQEVYSHQVFSFGPPDRPEGWYVTHTLAGTRPGGAIAAAWAVLHYLGEDGYLRLAQLTLDYVKRLRAGIEAIPGLAVLGDPPTPLFQFTSTSPDLDIFAIADGLTERGWLVWRDNVPVNSIRFLQSPGHAPYVDAYLRDLAEVSEHVRAGRIRPGAMEGRYT